MDTFDIGRLIYLVVLATAIFGYFLASGRHRMGQTLRHLLLWGLIFIGVLAGYGLWSDINRQILPRQISLAQGVIEAPRRADGHYYLTLRVNGTPVEFVVDTGASNIVLGERAAKKLGLTPPDTAYGGSAQTANGMVRTARVTLDTVELGQITDRNVTAYVTNGAMPGSLLGMDYLGRFSKIEVQGGKMVLTR